MIWGVLVYLMWGLFPAFFPLLEPAGAVEILAHRMLWTFVFMIGVLAVSRRLRSLRGIPVRTWGLVAAAAALISVNWGVYILAVNSGRVTEAALGYFINPLVTVMLGVVVMRESMRRMQIVAAAIAVVAVVLLTVAYGHPPYLSLLLAFSFGFYGLIKKNVRLDPAVSLTAEAAIVTPVALGLLAWFGASGTGNFLGHGAGHAVLMMSAGVVTAVPLLVFGIAAKKIPLVTLGMLQYLTPAIQMVWAVWVVHEYMDTSRWIGFGLIWASIAVFSADAVWSAARGRRAREGTDRTGGGRRILGGTTDTRETR